MKAKIAKLIRVIAIAPVMALVLISSLALCKDGFFGQGMLFTALAVLCICVFPVLAYPLQRFIPGYKGRGREGQRDLAIVMANIGYILGTLLAILLGANENTMMFFLTYLFSGLFIILFDKVLKIRASGHMCGVGGPVACMIYFIGAWAWIGVPFYFAVCWASYELKRHTIPEMIAGTAISVCSMFISILLTSLIY